MGPKTNKTALTNSSSAESKENDIIYKLKEFFNERFDRLEEKINLMMQTVLETEKRSKDNEIELRAAISRISKLENAIEEIKNKDQQKNESIEELKDKTSHLHDQLSEQTDRSLRTTLVFRGIKQDNTEKTWDDTKHMLADTLSNITRLDPNAIFSNIERAHRGKADHRNDNKRPLPIFVKFLSWTFSDHLRHLVIQHNIKTQNGIIFVDQMYSKPVMDRRKLALKFRYELLEDEKKDKENVNMSYYLTYPANLMGKLKG